MLIYSPLGNPMGAASIPLVGHFLFVGQTHHHQPPVISGMIMLTTMNLYAFHASELPGKCSDVHFYNCGLGISGLIKCCICCCCWWWWCWWWWWWWWYWWKRTRAHTGSAETRVRALLWPGHVKFRQRCICWGIDRRCRLGALEHVCLLVSPGEVGGGRGDCRGWARGGWDAWIVLSLNPPPLNLACSRHCSGRVINVYLGGRPRWGDQ